MNVKRILSFVALAGLLLLVAPTGRAQAASLISPGIAAAVQSRPIGDVTEVRWRHGWHRHYHWRRHYGWHRRWHHRRHWRRW
ncbi:MAG: hypothetical protein HXX15_06815 [Rhodopseudomonas sp.]|uniref:hypothetical protein n=1 Tax=Rhodopseudomonas sp. TaxID=1078 RepID=UPI001814465F|nr:hypothetical protein [Rhodopseudomonas sp.]NVN85786.1 hypothetical protein [Rhodopseudomonas sp.]